MRVRPVLPLAHGEGAPNMALDAQGKQEMEELYRFAQFNILAIVVAAEWIAAGEENLAAYVGKEYLTSPWNK